MVWTLKRGEAGPIEPREAGGRRSAALTLSAACGIAIGLALAWVLVRQSVPRHQVATGMAFLALTAVLPVLILRTRRRSARLEILLGPEQGKSLPMERSILRLGECGGKDGPRRNDLVVADAERIVAPFHCEIRRCGNNFFLIDLGSANGTYLDGERLEPGRLAPLRDGARIDLAHRCVIRFHIGEGA